MENITTQFNDGMAAATRLFDIRHEVDKTMRWNGCKDIAPVDLIREVYSSPQSRHPDFITGFTKKWNELVAGIDNSIFL